MSYAELSVRHFYQQHVRPFLDPTTRIDYDVQINHFEKYFCQLGLQMCGKLVTQPFLRDLSAAHVTGAIAWQLSRGRSPDTADKIRRVLLSVWNRAAEYYNVAPPPKVKRRQRPIEPVPVAWRMDEFNRILWAASQMPGSVGPFTMAEFMHAIVLHVYNTGWRINAVMSVRPDWVHLDAGVIRVEAEVQKDDEGQQVGLQPDTLEAIRPFVLHARRERLATIYDVWPYDRNDTRPWEWRTLTKRLKQMIVVSGLAENLDDVSRRDLWHRFRRTFATQIYLATGSIEEVRRMLGHSSIEVTRRYIDMSQVERKSQAELLPRPKASPLRIANA